MKIEYFGHSCFRVTSDNGVSWLCDPYTQVGYELPPQLHADVVTISHGHFDHNYIDGVQGIKNIVQMQGEFSAHGIHGCGIPCFHDDKNGALRGENIIFKVVIDGISFCHFGDLGEPCNDSLIEKIGNINVLMLPVGGTYTIDAAQAKRYVEILQPNVIIPMHYKPLDGIINITDAAHFLRQFDKKNIQCVGRAVVLQAKDIVEVHKKILYMEK